jgi:hypothetical protein
MQKPERTRGRSRRIRGGVREQLPLASANDDGGLHKASLPVVGERLMALVAALAAGEAAVVVAA